MGQGPPPGPADEPDAAAPAVRPGWLDEPHPERLPPCDPDRPAIVAAHRGALARGRPGYIDPRSGLFVFAAAYLHERGWCCDRGCRHCPYVGAERATGEQQR